MSGSGSCRDDLDTWMDNLPDEQPSRHNEGPWCDDCHGYTHMPWCSEYKGRSWEPVEELFPRYSFAVVTGRYKILDNRSDGPVRITQIATADGESEARLIVEALNNPVQLRFLGDRLEGQANQMADLAGENERLREALHGLGWHSQNGIDICWCHVKSDHYAKHTEQCAEARAALNHAARGEGK